MNFSDILYSHDVEVSGRRGDQQAAEVALQCLAAAAVSSLALDSRNRHCNSCTSQRHLRPMTRCLEDTSATFSY